MANTSANPREKHSKNSTKRRVPKRYAEQENKFPILDFFHNFPRLPLELREMIWNFAVPPRLISWHQDRPPAVLHTCHESRRLWLKRHQIDHWRTNIFDHETLFIDYNSDVLHFEGVMPGLKQWTEVPKKIKTPTGPPLYWPRWIGCDVVGGTKWLEEVQKLAIPVEDALKEFTFTPQSPRQWRLEKVNPWTKLNALCPNLRELIIVFGGGLSRNSAVEDWVDFGGREVPVEPWCWRWDVPNFRVKSFVSQRLGCLKQVQLRFVEVGNRLKQTNVQIAGSAQK